MQHFFRGGRDYGLGLCVAARASPFKPSDWAWSSVVFGLLPSSTVGGGLLRHFSIDGATYSTPTTFHAFFIFDTFTDTVSTYFTAERHQPYPHTSTDHVRTIYTVHWELQRAPLEWEGLPRVRSGETVAQACCLAGLGGQARLDPGGGIA